MADEKKTIQNKSKLFAICIFIALGIGLTEVVAYGFQAIFGISNPILWGLMFIFESLLWGVIIFGIVLISPPFRRFILRMFGADTDKSEIPKTTAKQEQVINNPTQEKTDIFELIQLVDCHKYHLFRYYDVYRGAVSPFFAVFIGLLFLIEVLTFGSRYILGTMTDLDIVVIVLSFIAAFTAFLSLMAQVGERNMIEVRFKRALKLKQFTEAEKPFLKALIKLRSRNPETDLEQIYKIYPDMFTNEKLLERLYHEKLFG